LTILWFITDAALKTPTGLLFEGVLWFIFHQLQKIFENSHSLSRSLVPLRNGGPGKLSLLSKRTRPLAPAALSDLKEVSWQLGVNAPSSRERVGEVE
jgi:hypothetical protein